MNKHSNAMESLQQLGRGYFTTYRIYSSNFKVDRAVFKGKFGILINFEAIWHVVTWGI